MRTNRRLILPSLSLAVALTGCSQDEAPPLTAASPQQLAVAASAAGIAPNAVLPRFGGAPVVAGARVVEVVPRADGTVQAEVRDATGAPITNAQLDVQVATEAGPPQPVSLRYDAQQQLYVGQAPAEAVVVPGRVEVTVRPRGGDPTTGHADAVPVAPVPSFGGQVVVVGPRAPEVRVEADGRVHAYVDTDDGELPDGELYVTVPVQSGPPARVELEYDGDVGHYVAALEPNVVVVPGPLEVELDLDGVQHRGRLATFTVGPRRTLGGEVVITGDYGVEMVEVDGEIHAAVYDVHGRPLANRPPRVVVHVEGHPQPVTLVWNAGLGFYVSPLRPGLTIVGAPARIEIHHHGRVHRGRFYYHVGPSFRVDLRGRPRHPHGGPPGLVGHPHGGPPGLARHPHGGPPGHAGVRVQAHGPSAMVHVAGPSAMVRVAGPSAMVRVDARHGGPPARGASVMGSASVGVRASAGGGMSRGGGGGGGGGGMGGGMGR